MRSQGTQRFLRMSVFPHRDPRPQFEERGDSL